MNGRLSILFAILLSVAVNAAGQSVTLSGVVSEETADSPVEYASILLVETGQWAITDEKGRFLIRDVSKGKVTLTVQCLGYQKRNLTMTLTKDVANLKLKIRQESLKLQEVTVTAHRKDNEATTSYSIDRTALDNQQILNIGDIAALLPGGKSVNPSLMDDSRMALRSGSRERGNAAFGTAVEIDGVRLDNNAMAGETTGASMRAVGTSNVESVEIITGIPSVEYGDLSNGVVKVNTRKGKSPLIVEGKLNQHTRQIALNKGLDLRDRKGVMNVSFEHARSFSDAASPYTAYQRNVFSLHYMNIFFRNKMPLTLNAGATANVGGYNSKADPDETLEDYTRIRDNAVRGNVELQWQPGKSWLTNLSLSGTLSYADKKTEEYSSQNSASTQPYIHSREEGYFIATDYDSDPDAPIILGPTGYWYVRRYNDSKPLSYTLKLKAEASQTSHAEASQKPAVRNRLLAGAELSGSHNGGRGTYYEDMRYAPSWREYRYDELPAMNNLAFYLEDKLTLPVCGKSALELTAGIRDDMTFISGSDYASVNSLSPRANSRYVFWREQTCRWVTDLNVHAGWGRSVKLPSFQVLYPSPSYADRLAFASPSSSDNRSYYVYHTYPSKAVYNADLRWQYTDQTDLGLELTAGGTKISLSAYHHRTYRPYMSTGLYTPMTYLYTAPSAVEGSGVSVENRRFAVDRQSGVVTLTDASGVMPAQQLAYTERNTYAVNSRYVNGSPVSRYGLEWVIDFAQIKSLGTSVRIDGNYYYYKGLDDLLFADIPLGVSSTMTGNKPYGYIGWYRGSNVTSAGSSANASVSNGMLSRQTNLNITVTTHVPRIRMIVALRLEASLYNYRRQLSELENGSRGYVLSDGGDYFGEPYDGSSENKFIAVYPEYYTTWEKPEEMIPFAEKFVWARNNDPSLYNDLAKLVVRSNYPYVMNADRLSRYYSANISVTKEIGDVVSLSFYANNFFRNMHTVRSSQTGLESSLFGSGYIPSFYYGLSMRIKI